MATKIYKLKELEKLPLGSIVYYKLGSTREVQDDSYEIGLLVQSDLDEKLEKIVLDIFSKAAEATYKSPVMHSIRKEAAKYPWDTGWDWDREVDSFRRKPRKLFFEENMPEGRNLIVILAPVPEHSGLAKAFAEGLEHNVIKVMSGYFS